MIKHHLIKGKSMIQLHSNPQWPEPAHLPIVTVNADFQPDALTFIFDVIEHRDCFRDQCHRDGDPCWQDSCVEMFLASPAHGGYYNFECSCTGACLGEFGQSRSPRRQFTDDEYAQIRRTLLIPPTNAENDQIHWSIKIEIPRAFIGLSQCDEVCGNLYKCASGAKIPHYLMAFSINTPTPDFHRPEFFSSLQSLL